MKAAVSWENLSAAPSSWLRGQIPQPGLRRHPLDWRAGGTGWEKCSYSSSVRARKVSRVEVIGAAQGQNGGCGVGAAGEGFSRPAKSGRRGGRAGPGAAPLGLA